jgi:hypothetical protein
LVGMDRYATMCVVIKHRANANIRRKHGVGDGWTVWG